MKTKLSLLVVVSLVMGADAPQEAATKDIAKAVQDLNDAFAKADKAAIKRLTTEDHVGIISPGVRRTLAEDLSGAGDYKLSSYTLRDLKITLLGPDAALVTYLATIKGTFAGKPYPEQNHVSAVWVRRAGKWVESYYQETAAAKP